MRALVLNSFDGPGSVTVAEVDDPIVADGEVLVRVDAAAVGSWDPQTTVGYFTAIGGIDTFPQILGWDLSGTVVEIGPGVTGLSVGDAVMGYSAQPWTGIGVFADEVSMSAALLIPRPVGLDMNVAATLPVVALTADMAVREAGLADGAALLVLGGAGAVGSLVTQLAAQSGIRVVGSGTARDLGRIEALGAQAGVDRSADVAARTMAAVGPVDAIIDLVGAGARPSAMGALRPGGRFVTTIHGPLPEGLTDQPRMISVQPDPDRLGQLARLVEAGTLRVGIGEVLALDDAREAYRLATGAGAAKIVLKP
jgi:NADPH:quinone reductase-like Zn-dependent oxidoreductase